MDFNRYGRGDNRRLVTVSHGNNIYRNCQLVTSPQIQQPQQQYLAPDSSLSSHRPRNENRQHYRSSHLPRPIDQQLISAPYYSVDEVLILQNGPARHYSNLSFQREDDVMVLDMFPTPSSFWPVDEDLTRSMTPTKVNVSDETIEANLKIKVYKTSASCLSNEGSSSDEDHDICVVCQDDFESQEKVGALRCGHEYHVDCIKKWLKNKNVCPICKATALPL